MTDFKDIPRLPGSREEKAWLADRLEVLSVMERTILAAALMRVPAKNCQKAINNVLSIPNYELISPAGSYEALGERWCDRHGIPPDAREYMNLWSMGRAYEDKHPGLFIGPCYVEYPRHKPRRIYDGTNLDKLSETSWSVRLKLASTKAPDGVWLKLPDRSLLRRCAEDEIALTFRELGIEDIRECRLLDARCSIPEVVGLAEQYANDLLTLLGDGDNLGYILEKYGREMPDFKERLSEAIREREYGTLKDVISAAKSVRHDILVQDTIKTYNGMEMKM